MVLSLAVERNVIIMVDAKHLQGLEFLEECTNEQLAPLVDIMRTNGSLSLVLLADNISVVAENYPKGNHRAYIPQIQEELLDFGSNTLGSRKSYKEVLMNVCKKMEAPYKVQQSIEEIESSLLAKVLDEAWQSLSEKERESIIKDLQEISDDKYRDKLSYGALAAAFQSGGFTSYKLSVIIANGISKAILGHGLSFAANAGLTKFLSIFTNPIITVLTGALAVWQIAGPAYRVTVPAVTYIACLRNFYNQ